MGFAAASGTFFLSSLVPRRLSLLLLGLAGGSEGSGSAVGMGMQWGGHTHWLVTTSAFGWGGVFLAGAPVDAASDCDAVVLVRGRGERHRTRWASPVHMPPHPSNPLHLSATLHHRHQPATPQPSPPPRVCAFVRRLQGREACSRQGTPRCAQGCTLLLPLLLANLRHLAGHTHTHTQTSPCQPPALRCRH